MTVEAAVTLETARCNVEPGARNRALRTRRSCQTFVLDSANEVIDERMAFQADREDDFSTAVEHLSLRTGRGFHQRQPVRAGHRMLDVLPGAHRGCSMMPFSVLKLTDARSYGRFRPASARAGGCTTASPHASPHRPLSVVTRVRPERRPGHVRLNVVLARDLRASARTVAGWAMSIVSSRDPFRAPPNDRCQARQGPTRLDEEPAPDDVPANFVATIQKVKDIVCDLPLGRRGAAKGSIPGSPGHRGSRATDRSPPIATS